MKRKHPGEEEIDRDELLRQRQQFMRFAANPNDQSSFMAAGTSREDARAAKHMRVVGSSRDENGGQVDQVAFKKAFLDLVKRIYEDPLEKKSYLENGRKGRLQCLVCGRFDGFLLSVSCVCFLLETLIALFLMVSLIGQSCRRWINEYEQK